MIIRRVDVDTSKEVLDYLQATCFVADAPEVYYVDDIWLIAMDGGIPAGFGCLRNCGHQIGYLAREGVIPPFRGQGLQRKIHTALERHARKEGYETIVSDCTAENTPSANNFIRTRYKVYNPVYKWGLPNAIYWYKDLK